MPDDGKIEIAPETLYLINRMKMGNLQFHLVTFLSLLLCYILWDLTHLKKKSFV